MVSVKSFAVAVAAIVAPLASALPVVSSRQSVGNVIFDSSKPFTLQTSVTKGNSSFSDFFLTSFHVGAAQQTIVGTTNSSKAIGWEINQGALQQPLSSEASSNLPSYNLTLLNQAPYRSSAPSGYDYISLSYSGSTPGFEIGFDSTNSSAIVHYTAAANSTLDFAGFALCYVNGTAPYFTVGPEYQLLWKKANTTSCYETCADVDLLAVNL